MTINTMLCNSPHTQSVLVLLLINGNRRIYCVFVLPAGIICWLCSYDLEKPLVGCSGPTPSPEASANELVMCSEETLPTCLLLKDTCCFSCSLHTAVSSASASRCWSMLTGWPDVEIKNLSLINTTPCDRRLQLSRMSLCGELMQM